MVVGRLPNILFHDLHIDLFHVNLLGKLWRKLGLLEQFRIHGRRHVAGTSSSHLATAGRRYDGASKVLAYIDRDSIY